MHTLKLLIASVAACAALACAPLQAETYDWVYRVDERPPDQVFASGFISLGTNTDLLDHTIGDSCPGAESQRSIWLSAYNSDDSARLHARAVLVARPNLPGIWVYSIHTNNTYLEVIDALRQLLESAYQKDHGYGSDQVRQLNRILRMPKINRRGEVVTRYRISPQTIQRAQYYFLDPSSTPANPILREGSGFTNAVYREPATQMDNITDDLTTILPIASVILYGEELAYDTDLCALCVEASSGSSSRVRRSELLERLNCPVPSRRQAFIGSED